jgi:hypothetical protein
MCSGETAMSDTSSAASDKGQELVHAAFIVLELHITQAQELAVQVVENFASITPPNVEVGEIGKPKIDFFTINKDSNSFSVSGSTIKPGNIFLNWRKLLNKLPEMVLTGSGTTSVWLAPFAALQIWNILWSNARIEVTPNHAIAMLVMWNNRDGRNKITEENAFAGFSKFLQKEGLPSLDKREYAKIIDDLVRIETIEITEGVVWLREWVKVVYH